VTRPHAVEIAGAGPAGLAAGITIARAGGRARIRDRGAAIGHRFHGDFQGLENWTTEEDVLAELSGIGIEPTFEHTPFRECTFFDPQGRAYRVRSREPMWYLVRRGTAPRTLDSSLAAQARSAGVELRLGERVDHQPDGGIVAHGPHRPDVIAVGYTFTTDRADAAFGAVADDLAPKGYAYLLIAGGRGTIASCMFADFHNEKRYRERTVAFFRDRVGLTLTDATPFGGFGNVYVAPRARRGRMLFAGEAAGFQDALFGFGMRYALLSGHVAARACLAGRPDAYARLWRPRLGGLLQLGLVNRYLYEWLGNRGYAALLRRVDRAPDARAWLRRFYTAGPVRRRLALWARWRLGRVTDLVRDCPEGCDCTWCRCRHDGVQHDPIGEERR